MIHLDELCGQLVEQEVDGMEEEGDGQVEVKGEVEEKGQDNHIMDDYG